MAVAAMANLPRKTMIVIHIVAAAATTGAGPMILRNLRAIGMTRGTRWGVTRRKDKTRAKGAVLAEEPRNSTHVLVTKAIKSRNATWHALAL